jgi:hypothetical protein
LLNAIPNGRQLRQSEEDDAIRKMVHGIMVDDFDQSPKAAAMHMPHLVK